MQCSDAKVIKILSRHGGIVLAKSKQQQEAHGIGQIEQQLNDQMEAAADIQGPSKLDQEIKKAAHRHFDSSNEPSE